VPDGTDLLGMEFDEMEDPEAPSKRNYVSEAMFYRYLYQYRDLTDAPEDTQELRRKFS